MATIDKAALIEAAAKAISTYQGSYLYERSALRLCASELERLLDQIEADVKGGER